MIELKRDSGKAIGWADMRCVIVTMMGLMAWHSWRHGLLREAAASLALVRLG